MAIRIMAVAEAFEASFRRMGWDASGKLEEESRSLNIAQLS